jgi:6-pyruvoyltetrahydropterin/6-carboxytetrahydropterin synthase
MNICGLISMTNKEKIVYITRRERFNAAHKLYNPKWTEAENEAFFGKCSNKYYHGHNFELLVTIKGIANPETGMVMDLKKMKHIIRDLITEKLDHRNLNEDVDFLKGMMPSIENIVVKIWEILDPHIENGKLHCIKLIETENNFVEYYGD